MDALAATKSSSQQGVELLSTATVPTTGRAADLRLAVTVSQILWPYFPFVLAYNSAIGRDPTGAFGNLGTATLEELVARGHQVRAFDRPSWRTRRLARSFQERIEIAWGDIRSSRDVRRAVKDQYRVVHLAFIIPSISATGISSEIWPRRARKVNVEGTANLIRCLEDASSPTALRSASGV